MISTVFMTPQICCTILALILNSFVVYVVIRNTKSKIGFYKYMLISFRCFEMTFAVVVLVGMPINFIADNSWIVFNHEGLIGKTTLNWLGPTLYCTFYELWIGLLVVHFLYRYIVVCRDSWKESIAHNKYLQMLLILIYLSHVGYSFICGLFFCTREVMSEDLKSAIEKEFRVDNVDTIGYTLIRTFTEEGRLSALGIASLMNHYVLVTISFTIINICGYKVWRQIAHLQKQSFHMQEINLQKQMFITLVIQTVVPMLLCHIPSAIYLTFPFWSKSFTFGALASVFSFLTTIPEVLDPIVTLCCIREYRRAAKGIIIRKTDVGTLHSSSQHASPRLHYLQKHEASA